MSVCDKPKHQSVTPPSSAAARSLKGTLVGGFSFAMQAALSIVSVPFLVGGWGQERYGVWLAAQAFVGLVLSLDFGHQAYVGNELGKLYHIDLVKAKVVLGSALLVAFGLGVFETALVQLFESLGLLEKLLGVDTLTAATERLHLVVTVLIAAWALVGSTGGLLARLYAPTGQFARGALWVIPNKVLLTAATMLAASLQLSLLATALAMAGVMILFGIVFGIDAWKVLPEFRPFYKPASLKEGTKNLLRSLVLTATSILSQLQTSGLLLIVSGKFGVATVAVFGTLRTMSNTLLQAAGTIFAPAVPELVRLDVRDEGSKLAEGIFTLSVFTTTLASLGSFALTLLAEPLYSTWTRGRMPFDATLFSSIVVATLWRVAGLPIINHITAMNDRRWISLIALAHTGALFLILFCLSNIFQLRRGALGGALVGGELVGSFLLPLAWGAYRFRGVNQRLFRRLSALQFLTPTLATAGIICGLITSQAATALGISAVAVLSLFGVQWRHIPPNLRAELRDRILRRLSRRVDKSRDS
jgi:O-antigen/teichoic acid export membrane protein